MAFNTLTPLKFCGILLLVKLILWHFMAYMILWHFVAYMIMPQNATKFIKYLKITFL
jgi:hypothetical protein